MEVKKIAVLEGFEYDEEIFVEEGDTVNAGDNLMLIKPLDE